MAVRCRERHHRPAGNRRHPGPPRVPRRTRPAADAALTGNVAHPMAGALAKRATDPPGGVGGPSAWGPRGCQRTPLRRFTDVEPELEEFAVDPRCSPAMRRHLADETANLRANPGTAGPAGEVGPVTAEALTVPLGERIRLDDQLRRSSTAARSDAEQSRTPDRRRRAPASAAASGAPLPAGEAPGSREPPRGVTGRPPGRHQGRLRRGRRQRGP